jgi:hypothetical protein
MTHSKETLDLFYQHIAKAFYSVAAADKKVKEEEVETLRELVKSRWTKVEDSTDEFGTDAALQIESVFDWLLEENVDSMDALNDFKDFKEQNESLFTSKINKLVFETADAIASSFSGKNKSELTVLTQLNLILNK